MSEKHIVVQGATLKCMFSLEPKTDKLKVLSQSKHFANEIKGTEKLIATDQELGKTLEKNTFGKCKMQPNGKGGFLPCQVVITKWIDFYDKVTLSNKGKILLEDSKAACPFGSSNCISVDNHGQKTQGSIENAQDTNKTVHKQINPLSNLKQEESALKFEGIKFNM
jgi:Domain of unknown function (DUF4280)